MKIVVFLTKQRKVNNVKQAFISLTDFKDFIFDFHLRNQYI